MQSEMAANCLVPLRQPDQVRNVKPCDFGQAKEPASLKICCVSAE